MKLVASMNISVNMGILMLCHVLKSMLFNVLFVKYVGNNRRMFTAQKMKFSTKDLSWNTSLFIFFVQWYYD